MFLLKLGSELQNLIRKLQSVLKISTKCRLHFHEVEYFYEVECTRGRRLNTSVQNVIALPPAFFFLNTFDSKIIFIIDR